MDRLNIKKVYMGTIEKSQRNGNRVAVGIALLLLLLIIVWAFILN